MPALPLPLHLLTARWASAGILYALLHVPALLAAVPGAQRDVQAALQYVLTLECDAEGRPGKQAGRRSLRNACILSLAECVCAAGSTPVSHC